MTPRPLYAPTDRVTVEQIPFHASDGTELDLCRLVANTPVNQNDTARPAVLLLHGLTASADMFVLPETRNLADVLLSAGYEPWLLDWRGSCRLPYNEGRVRYTFDDVAAYDIPDAVSYIRGRIGQRQLFVVAHCIGALSLALSMTGGLVPGLAGVVAQGVFMTPKYSAKSRLLSHLGGEWGRSRWTHLPVDFTKVGFRSRHTPMFALASLAANDCDDPTCHILHNSAWGTGASLYVHENLHETTHSRLAELFGSAPTWIMPHLRRMELAHTVMPFHTADQGYGQLPENAVDSADSIDCPVLLLAGSENKLWHDSNELCYDVLSGRYPELDIRYVEIPGYGHVDTFIGRGAALDVFGHIVDFLDERSAVPL